MKDEQSRANLRRRGITIFPTELERKRFYTFTITTAIAAGYVHQESATHGFGVSRITRFSSKFEIYKRACSRGVSVGLLHLTITCKLYTCFFRKEFLQIARLLTASSGVLVAKDLHGAVRRSLS